MVARAHDRVQESNDPTAHAVIVAVREAARQLGTARLAEATIFTTLEPCAMCVGALLESDVEALVYACPNDVDGAAGTVLQLAQHPDLPRRLRLVTGIRRDEAEELFGAQPRTEATGTRTGRTHGARLLRCRIGRAGRSRGNGSRWRRSFEDGDAQRVAADRTPSDELTQSDGDPLVSSRAERCPSG